MIGRPVLTKREREVIELVTAGLQNKEIAACLGISPSTVKAHVSVCFLKCGVRTRTALATWYLDEGLTASATRAPGGRDA